MRAGRGTILLGVLAAIIFVGVWIASGDDGDDSSSPSTTATTTEGGNSDDDSDANTGSDGSSGSADGSDSDGGGTIGRLLAADSDFSIFAGALDDAGLLSGLDESGPFTVFAPADDGIDAAILEATITSSDADAQRTLAFHVADGMFTIDDLVQLRTIDTLAGQALRAFPLAEGGGVLLNNGVAIRETIESTNGIIHVIDRLLVPSGSGASPDTDSSTTTSVDPDVGDDTTTTAADTTTTTTPPASTGELSELTGLDPIQFADSSSVIAPESTPTLDRIVEILQANSDAQIEIGGHTDNVGAVTGNQRLSERRATAVRDYLVEAGVDAARLTAVGYGSDQPIDSNDTAEGRAANRRIEFTVL